MEGIDSLLDNYPSTDLRECATAFADIGAAEIAIALGEVVSKLPVREEVALSKADWLIKLRVGYDYEAIRESLLRRLTASRLQCNLRPRFPTLRTT